MIFSRCNACGKRALWIRKRTMEVPNVGRITSQNRLCGKCAEKIRRLSGAK